MGRYFRVYLPRDLVIRVGFEPTFSRIKSPMHFQPVRPNHCYTYPVRESNPHHQVRSLASCPLNERGKVDLAGIEPASRRVPRAAFSPVEALQTHKWGDQRESNPHRLGHNQPCYRYTMVTADWVGIAPTYQGFQSCANLSQLPADTRRLAPQ